MRLFLIEAQILRNRLVVGGDGAQCRKIGTWTTLAGSQQLAQTRRLNLSNLVGEIYI